MIIAHSQLAACFVTVVENIVIAEFTHNLIGGETGNLFGCAVPEKDPAVAVNDISTLEQFVKQIFHLNHHQLHLAFNHRNTHHLNHNHLSHPENPTGSFADNLKPFRITYVIIVI